MDCARVLIAARFTVDALGARWGGEADDALERGNRLPAVRALADDRSPLATLAALFLVLGLPVDREAAESALAEPHARRCEGISVLCRTCATTW